MKKRLFAALLCLILVVSFAACDMEFGGLVGELLGEGGAIGGVIDRPDVEDSWIEETWVEDETVSYPMHLYAG